MKHKGGKDRTKKAQPPYARKSLKKDTGVPDLKAFKEKFAEKEKKRKAEKEKQEKQRQVFQGTSMEALVANAQERSDIHNAAEEAAHEEDDGTYALVDGASSLQKDNSRKAYYREFRKVLEHADVILEVLDARDPLGCRTRHVERMIMDNLVPKANVEGWLKYLRNEYPAIAFKSSTQSQRTHLGHSTVSTDVAPQSLLNTSECLGADSLIKLLKNYSRNQNLKTSITVGVIGYPNVGKSSVINSLRRSRVCGVGATPGLTKVAQQIQLDKNIKLLDCPGIVFATQQKGEDAAEIALRNCIKVELLDDPITPVGLLLTKCHPNRLSQLYGVPAFGDVQEFLLHVAQARGKLQKGGIPDLTQAARTVLQDWNSGKIPYHTVPPSSETSLGAAAVVQGFGEVFDLDGLLQEADAEVAVYQGLNDGDDVEMEPIALQADSMQADRDLEI